MPYAVLAAALVALDQLVKYLVLHNIPLGAHVPLYPPSAGTDLLSKIPAPPFPCFRSTPGCSPWSPPVMSVLLAVAIWKKFFHHPLRHAAP